MSERDLVFFSYRHDVDGERWLSILRANLEPYVLLQQLRVWTDGDIRTGEQWNARIQDAIDHTRVAVLLVNQRYFASDYIRTQELPRLVAAARAGKLTLVGVLIGFDDPALRAECGLDEFQFAHEPKIPLNTLRGAQRERAAVEVAMKVRAAYSAAGPATAQRPPPVAQGELAQPLPSAPTLAAAGRLAPLLGVPPMNPARLVIRHAEMEAIRGQLLEGIDLPHGPAAGPPGLGLHGMGGMGKSVMAQALCHDEALRRAFPDGIAWLELGERPDLLAMQNRLLRLLDPQARPADSGADASLRLRNSLEGRRVLVVIDDLWDMRHFEAFNVVQGRSRLLLTTRDATLLSAVGARRHALQPMPRSMARDLLALHCDSAPDSLPSEADEVVAQTGGLPLALALAGAQVADGVSWPTLVQQLREGRIEFLDHPYASLYSSLGRSVDALPDLQRRRYLELAVFPKNLAVPADVVARLWRHRGGLNAADSEQLLGRLDRKALLTISGSGAARRVALHDLQHDFLRLRADDLPALHGGLLEAYRASLALPDGAAG